MIQVASEKPQDWQRLKHGREPQRSVGGSLDRLERQSVIRDSLPMVRHCVNRLVGLESGTSLREDLISAGTVGLVEASKAFDPTRVVKFSTFSYHRIRGAILDEWRRNCSLPTAAYHQLRHIRQRQQELVSELGYPPTEEELASAVGITPDKLRRRLARLEMRKAISAGETEDVPDCQDPTPGPVERAETDEALDRMARSLAELPPRVRGILSEYYQKEKTMKQIGRVLGVSESRVSQLCSCGLAMLRKKMNVRKPTARTILRFDESRTETPCVGQGERLGFFGAA